MSKTINGPPNFLLVPWTCQAFVTSRPLHVLISLPGIFSATSNVYLPTHASSLWETFPWFLYHPPKSSSKSGHPLLFSKPPLTFRMANVTISNMFICMIIYHLSSPLDCKLWKGCNSICFVYCEILSAWERAWYILEIYIIFARWMNDDEWMNEWFLQHTVFFLPCLYFYMALLFEEFSCSCHFR